MCKGDAVLCTLLQTRVSAFKVQDLAAYDMLKLPVLQLHVPVNALEKHARGCQNECPYCKVKAASQALHSHVRLSSAGRAQHACMRVVSNVVYRTAGKQHWQELL